MSKKSRSTPLFQSNGERFDANQDLTSLLEGDRHHILAQAINKVCRKLVLIRVRRSALYLLQEKLQAHAVAIYHIKSIMTKLDLTQLPTSPHPFKKGGNC